MRNIMPASIPALPPALTTKLAALGQHIRARRKTLLVSATVAAESAGMSRVTLHRIERGEPSVTMGAYLNAMAALGLDFGIVDGAPVGAARVPHDTKGWIPARIVLADYPQLKRLAWHVQGTGVLTPAEALGVYERHLRHLDLDAMEPREQDLLEALRLGLGQGPVDV